MNKKHLSLYSLKFNPFSPQVPVDALYLTPAMDHFCWRVQTQLTNEGGFATLSGDPGAGKSVTLRQLANRLGTQRDVSVGVLAHATPNIADFYREMGDIFGVSPGCTNAGVASRRCASVGRPIWRPLTFTWYCSRMRLRRCRQRC